MPFPGELRPDDSRGGRPIRPHGKGVLKIRLKMIVWAVISLAAIMTVMYSSAAAHRNKSLESTRSCPRHFAGDSTAFEGSCWCGGDNYCMCTPSLAIDAVIELTDPHTGQVKEVLVIRRKDNGKLACVGGFVAVGETLEKAVTREVWEETGLHVSNLRMLPRVYDNPSRDTRRHTVSVAYAVRVDNVGAQRAGEEEESVVMLPLDKLKALADEGEFSFDHAQIFMDYLESHNKALSETLQNLMDSDVGVPVIASGGGG
ncbi:unnamed protein product [Choristocarpus tenellus]